ncbi:MAG: hypothetical protein WC238_02515 [Parcubacteria group bacterium]|jgi:hypothetical protein
MRFDLTREITLNKESARIYGGLRIFLYLSAALAAIYLAYLILFPSRFFAYSSVSSAIKDNNINSPRDEQRVSIADGKITADKNFYFDTPVSGIFSKAIVNFSLSEKSSALDLATVNVRKSYAAFLYPEGAAVGFKDGSMVKNAGNYYLVSNGELRHFATPTTVSALGFSPDAFLEVTPEDLRANPNGQAITDTANYPDAALFKINEDYFIWQNSQLKKFTSSAAFTSQYRTTQAIEKDEDFLNSHAVSADLIGYSDGSLISYGESIYVVSSGNILPIDNPETFLGHSYDFIDVLSAGADEIAQYDRGKLFNITSPHPAGSILRAAEDGEYYMIANTEKHHLPSENIAKSWLYHSPIPVSKAGLDTTSSCSFQKDFWKAESYTCEIPIENMQQLIGNNYEFSLRSPSDTRVNSIHIEFKKDANSKNFRAALAGILNRIILTYVPGIQNQQ